jgi:hypothetical protein
MTFNQTNRLRDLARAHVVRVMIGRAEQLVPFT